MTLELLVYPWPSLLPSGFTDGVGWVGILDGTGGGLRVRKLGAAFTFVVFADATVCEICGVRARKLGYFFTDDGANELSKG